MARFGYFAAQQSNCPSRHERQAIDLYNANDIQRKTLTTPEYLSKMKLQGSFSSDLTIRLKLKPFVRVYDGNEVKT
jgi:hypothetical protein